MSEKCCGTCRWFDPEYPGDGRFAPRGLCGWANHNLPSVFHELMRDGPNYSRIYASTHVSKGTDCPVHAFIEAAEDE